MPGDQRDKTQLKRRHAVTSAERQAIRSKHRDEPEWTQSQLAKWATREFGRPIRQSVVSDSLHARYSYVDAAPVVVSLSTSTLHLLPEQINPWIAPPPRPLSRPRSSGSGNGYFSSRFAATDPFVEALYQEDHHQTATDAPIGWKHQWSTHVVPLESDEEDQVEEVIRTDNDMQRSRLDIYLQNRKDAALPKAAKPASLYLTQFFSGLVTNAISLGDVSTLDPYTKWFTAVAGRVSRSPPLHEAFRSLLIRHAGAVTGDDRVVRSSRHYYGKALSSIQEAINAANGINSDIVSATMLLAYYEAFDCNERDREPFLNHTRGATKIIKLLGPEHFMDEYGRTVLLAFGGQLIVSMFNRDCDYFLMGKDWAPVTASAREKDTSWNAKGLAVELYMHLQTISNLRKDINRLDQLGFWPPDAVTKIDLMDRLFKLRSQLQDYRRRFQTLIPSLDKPVPRPGDPASLPHVVGSEQSRTYRPSVPRAASAWCSFLALFIGTQQLLSKVEPSLDFSIEEAEIMGQVREALWLVPVSSCLARMALLVFQGSE